MTHLTPERLRTWLGNASTGDAAREAALLAGTAAAARCSAGEMLDLVLLAHGVPSEDAASRLRTAIVSHDETFTGRPNERQTHVAASWTLARVLEAGGSLSIATSLAIGAADFCGFTPQPEALRSYAAGILAWHQRNDRKRTPVPKNNAQRSVVSPELDAVGQVSGQQLREIADALTESVNTAIRLQRGVIDALNSRLAIADEEMNVLWWMALGRHEGDGVRWEDLGAAASVAAGMDLAAMTAIASPMPGARSLLSRVLRGVRPASMAEAIAAAPEDALREEPVLHRLLPITTSTSYRATYGTDWMTHTAEALVDTSTSYDAVQLAEQALRETLLRRHL